MRTFWRGLDDMAVSEDFMAQGGTEIGCMSTSESVGVARKFAKVGKTANPLLLKVEATSLMDCGADIGWLSMYPEEKEVLFPPLTYLRVVEQDKKKASSFFSKSKTAQASGGDGAAQDPVRGPEGRAMHGLLGLRTRRRAFVEFNGRRPPPTVDGIHATVAPERWSNPRYQRARRRYHK